MKNIINISQTIQGLSNATDLRTTIRGTIRTAIRGTIKGTVQGAIKVTLLFIGVTLAACSDDSGGGSGGNQLSRGGGDIVASINCQLTESSETSGNNTTDPSDLDDACTDTDGDTVFDIADNCPLVANLDQADNYGGGPDKTDSNTIGDACEDTDGDAHLDLADNCPLVANLDQVDNYGGGVAMADPNGIGDVCDDTDADTVLDLSDNCPLVANLDQEDNYGGGFIIRGANGIGDACDDTDADTVLDIADNCPLVANLDQADNYGGGLDKTFPNTIGDACEDTDADTVFDVADNCPLVANLDQADNYGGGVNMTDPNTIGDACDDIDADKVFDLNDNCPLVANLDQVDNYGGGVNMTDPNTIGDACEDTDADTILDLADNCPLIANLDQVDNYGGGVNMTDPNTIGDACDDTDADTVFDLSDNCPLVANLDQADNYGGGASMTEPNTIGDACDDIDADTVFDLADNCPLVANLDQADNYGGGVNMTDPNTIGDACDDTDADAVLDIADNCPLVNSLDQNDEDSDSLGNPCDIDDDGDGLVDIRTAAELDLVRADLTGKSLAGDNSGCGGGVDTNGTDITSCNGYELLAHIDLNDLNANVSSATSSDVSSAPSNDVSSASSNDVSSAPFNDVSSANWESIGADIDGQRFTAEVFEGNDYHISNMRIRVSADIGSIGFLGAVTGSVDKPVELRNIHIRNASIITPECNPINPSHYFVGVLLGIGYFANIDSSSVTFTDILGGCSQVGGLVGNLESGNIHASAAIGDKLHPDAGNDVGALVGYVYASTDVANKITASYAIVNSMGNLSGADGGLIGWLRGDIVIESSYASIGEIVQGNFFAGGGLVGYANGFTNAGIISSYALVANNNWRPSRSGGLVGLVTLDAIMNITDSYWDNEILTLNSSHNDFDRGKSTSMLQSPTDFSGGIYANWGNAWCNPVSGEFINDSSVAPSVAIDANRVWLLGENNEYPVLGCNSAFTPVEQRAAISKVLAGESPL